MTSHLPDEHVQPAGLAEDPLVDALRRAGCVFAEDEAALIRRHALAAELDDLLRRRIAGEPLEHLLGWVQFGGLRLSVGPGVFVPRQRSLLLAREAVTAAAQRREPVVLEAFCGVAPIASAVAATVDGAQVHAADIAADALVHARRNLPDRAQIHHGIGFDGIPASLRGRVEVIAAVPPYVPEHAFDLLAPEARDHEPRRALTGGVDGLHHIEALIADAQTWLSDDGVLLVEMNVAQFDAVAVRDGHSSAFALDAVPGDDGQTVVARLRRRVRAACQTPRA
ncbi:N5-glutamine methyltransferase family protein [Gordonia amicalis]|uniref:N5-glutamine methyltransferase family protein n=1 Tax=Gordonia amicalis TaxID=89053 RepID=UPI0015F5B875|nr:HemK family protein methyltransferase [Gordonia amicalis]MBA5848252.1 HemK family protein methyltransferase [Gordonia amicalis]